MSTWKNFKIGISGYWDKTPKLIKKIGLALMAFSAAGIGCGFVWPDETWPKILAISGALGKFLTTFIGSVDNEKVLDEKVSEVAEKLEEANKVAETVETERVIKGAITLNKEKPNE